MARHIDYAYAMPAGEIEKGEAKLYSDAPLFFLFETIRLKTGQGTNKACFSMVNMAGGTKNNFTHKLDNKGKSENY
jgi:hypothetical protein